MVTEIDVGETPRAPTRDDENEKKFKEQTLSGSNIGRQPREVLPQSRTRLLEPADIWRDLTRR